MTLRLAGYIFLILGTPFFLLVSIRSNFFDNEIQNSKQQFDNENAGWPYLVEEINESGQIIKEYTGFSIARELDQIARDLAVPEIDQDRIVIFPEIKYQMGGKITLRRAPTFTVIDGKKETIYRSWQTTVQDLIYEKGIELGLEDKISPSLESEIKLNDRIQINRVAKTTVVVPEAIKYKTVYKQNSEWEKSVKKTIQKGASGTLNKYYLVTREDGVEISRKYQRSEIARESTDEIIEIGTRVVVYGSGKATWYRWPSMESRGEKYYAAHKTLTKGTEVWVVNPANGKGVRVTILDRVAANVEIDLSPSAFGAIGSTSSGVINVRVEKFYP